MCSGCTLVGWCDKSQILTTRDQICHLISTMIIIITGQTLYQHYHKLIVALTSKKIMIQPSVMQSSCIPPLSVLLWHALIVGWAVTDHLYSPPKYKQMPTQSYQQSSAYLLRSMLSFSVSMTTTTCSVGRSRRGRDWLVLAPTKPVNPGVFTRRSPVILRVCNWN